MSPAQCRRPRIELKLNSKSCDDRIQETSILAVSFEVTARRRFQESCGSSLADCEVWDWPESEEAQSYESAGGGRHQIRKGPLSSEETRRWSIGHPRQSASVRIGGGKQPMDEAGLCAHNNNRKWFSHGWRRRCEQWRRPKQARDGASRHQTLQRDAKQSGRYDGWIW